MLLFRLFSLNVLISVLLALIVVAGQSFASFEFDWSFTAEANEATPLHLKRRVFIPIEYTDDQKMRINGGSLITDDSPQAGTSGVIKLRTATETFYQKKFPCTLPTKP